MDKADPGGMTPVTSQPGDRALSQPAEEELLEWTVHLARRHPAKIAAVVLTALVAGFAGFWLVRSAFVGIVGGFLILCASAEFLLPIHYRLTTRRAMSGYGLARLELEWGRVRRILRSDDSVRLSLFPADCRLDRLRGLRLRAEDAETLDRIVEIARERVRETRGDA